MRLAFAFVLVVHGLIHLLGVAKAFQFAELPQLTRPVPPVIGVLWLAAALLFVVAAGALFWWSRWWWAIGASAIAVSMVAIIPSWADAKLGALANLIVLVGVVFGFFWSDDRLQASPDGTTMTSTRWSTPVGDYRAFGPMRLATRGEGRWHEPDGEYAYLELQLDDVQYNVRSR